MEGGPSENDMLSYLPSGTEASSVKIYTIAYGDDADLDVLTTLANRTNGGQFSGDVEDIEAVYFLISSEF
jgi:Ca-activated chloride channel family protein